MNRIRITTERGDNLYRFKTVGTYGLHVEAFQKDSEVRKIDGRWFACQNFEVHAKIAKRIGRKQ